MPPPVCLRLSLAKPYCLYKYGEGRPSKFGQFQGLPDAPIYFFSLRASINFLPRKIISVSATLKTPQCEDLSADLLHPGQQIRDPVK